ncbi:hypothetical protein AX17_005830 [Amanita inopinata Kibby_2008]|nr:hypothetical protein AX17_005830 [Amanita inopinata Kibby_2008]
MSSTESKNPQRVAGGLKATMHNPKTSDEAKHSAHERLQQLEPELESHHRHTAANQAATKNTGNVLGGHKATLSNKNASEEAKEHSREVLEHANDDEAELEDADYEPSRDE